MIEQKIKTILSKQLGIELDSIQPDVCIMNDLGADSLDVLEIIMAVESAFKIELDGDSMQGINTVRKLAEHIQNTAVDQ